MRREFLIVPFLLLIVAPMSRLTGSYFSLNFSGGAYLIEAGMMPNTIYMWLLALALYLVPLYLRPPELTRTPRPPARWARLAAFLVDFVVILYLISVPIVMLALALEATRVGEFAWYVSRDHGEFNDVYVWIAAMAGFVAFFALLTLPGWRGKQSLGGYFFGFLLRNADELTFAEALVRSGSGMLAVPKAMLGLGPSKGRMDHDIKYGTEPCQVGGASEERPGKPDERRKQGRQGKQRKPGKPDKRRKQGRQDEQRKQGRQGEQRKPVTQGEQDKQEEKGKPGKRRPRRRRRSK